MEKVWLILEILGLVLLAVIVFAAFISVLVEYEYRQREHKRLEEKTKKTIRLL